MQTLMSRLIGLCFFLGLFVFPAAAKDGEKLPLLTTVREVRVLSPVEAAKGYPVKLTGVVTYHESGWFLTFLQDETGGIFIRAFGTTVRAGDKVEISGISAAGSFGRIVVGGPERDVETRVIGAATYPQPVEVAGKIDHIRHDARWISVSGEVSGVREANGRFLIELMRGEEALTLAIPVGTQSGAPPLHLEGLRVTAQGVFGLMERQEKPQEWLFLPSLEQIRIDPESLEKLYATPVQPGVEIFLGSMTNTGARSHVHGQVRMQIPGLGFFLTVDSDARWANVWVASSQAGTLRPGEMAQAVGRPERVEGGLVLRDAVFRRTGEGTAEVPRRMRPGDAPGSAGHGTLVTLTATVVKHQRGAMEDLWVLDDGSVVFQAHLPADAVQQDGPLLEKDTVVEATGVLLLRPLIGTGAGAAQAGFLLQLRSEADLVVVKLPPWWTQQRIRAALAVVSAVLVLAFIWALILNRKNRDLARQVMAREEAEAALRLAHERLSRRAKRRKSELREEISARNVAEGVLEERSRLARELHDNLAQALAGIGLQLEAAVRGSERAPEAVPQHLELARRLVRETQGEIRSSVWNLRSQVLEENDLPGALEIVTRQAAQGSGLPITVEVSGRVVRLPELVESNFLRLGQEAVANAIKHARATDIRVELEYSEEDALLRVTDDGVGFDPKLVAAPAYGHFGLLGMRERVKRIGGQLQISSAPGAGTVIEVRLALTPPITSSALKV